MAKRTIFEIDGYELTIFINDCNEIHIFVGDHEDGGCICLDLEDAIEFRDEFNKLINKLS